MCVGQSVAMRRDPYDVKGMDADMLVGEYRSLVGSIVAQLRRQFRLTVETDELVSWGYLGLLEAHDRFDPAVGTLFATYAYYRVRGKILDCCRQRAWGDGNALRRECALHEMLQRNFEIEEERKRATSLGDAIERAQFAIGCATTVCLLADLDSVANVEAAQLDAVEHMDLLRVVLAEVDILPVEEQYVIRRHHLEGATMYDISVELRRSISWVSRTNSRALDRLREHVMAVT